MQEAKRRTGLSTHDILHAAALAIACFVSYWVAVDGLAPFVARDKDLLGGMWAVIATIFVYRETLVDSQSAGISRFAATCVSIALCLIYLVFFPSTPAGLAILVGIGTVLMAFLGRRGDIITTAITTAVVMVVAAIGPDEAAWHQPLLRLVDTVIGIGVGVSVRWIFSSVLYGWVVKQTHR